MSQLARKTQSGMEEIDPEEELVSIWAKSGTKEVSSLDMLSRYYWSTNAKESVSFKWQFFISLSV